MVIRERVDGSEFFLERLDLFPDTRAPSDVSQLNGDFHRLICELASTVKTLADKVSKLEDNDITTCLTNANAQANSPEVNHSHITCVPISDNHHRSIRGPGNFAQPKKADCS